MWNQWRSNLGARCPIDLRFSTCMIRNILLHLLGRCLSKLLRIGHLQFYNLSKQCLWQRNVQPILEILEKTEKIIKSLIKNTIWIPKYKLQVYYLIWENLNRSIMRRPQNLKQSSTCFYLVNKWNIFFQSFVVFSKKLDFIKVHFKIRKKFLTNKKKWLLRCQKKWVKYCLNRIRK